MLDRCKSANTYTATGLHVMSYTCTYDANDDYASWFQIAFQHCQNLAAYQLESVEKTMRDFNTTAEVNAGTLNIKLVK